MIDYGLFDGVNFTECILKNKPIQQRNYLRYMFARTQAMFEYTNLPESIPRRELELQLQAFGHVGFIHRDGNLYALRGNFAGKPNPYYIPEDYLIANPSLNFSKEYKIGEDIVVVKNDSMYTGLMPLFLRYSTQLVENDLSMMIAIINTRIINYLIANDDEAMESAKEFIKGIINGDFGVIGGSEIFEAIRSLPSSTLQNSITELIEAQQYLKAGWFNELGLRENYNMKREAINSEEANMTHDALFPLIDDMLNCRKEGVEAVNEMFGTDISVDFASVWKVNDVTLDNVEEDNTGGQTDEEVIEISDDADTEPEDTEPEEPDEPEDTEEETTEEETTEDDIVGEISEETINEIAEEVAEEVVDILEETGVIEDEEN